MKILTQEEWKEQSDETRFALYSWIALHYQETILTLKDLLDKAKE